MTYLRRPRISPADLPLLNNCCSECAGNTFQRDICLLHPCFAILFYIFCLMDEKALTYVTFYHIICFIFSWLIKEFYTLISNSDYIRGPPLPTELYESILHNYNHSLRLCGTKQGSEFLSMGFEVLFFKKF